ncbi:ATPase, F1/V1/A1 complex, alpha/beta subunit [Tanacetum coccineum]
MGAVMKAGFLDSGGGGGKKKKSNNNAPFGSGLDYCSMPLVDVTGTIHVGTGLNGGNGNVNDGTIPSIFVDSRNAVKEGTTTAGTTPGKSSYANVTGKPSGKKVNFHTLFTPGGNGIDVVVPMESIRAIRLFSFQFSSMEGLNSMLENGPWFIRNNLIILRKWHPDVNLLKENVGTVPVWVKLYGVPVTAFSEDGLSAIATKLELKDNIVAVMPKITRDGYYTCNIHVEYEWKRPRCAWGKVFRHVQEECPKNTGAGVTKNLKKTSQTPKGIPVGQKMGFKTKQLNPFGLLTSVDNDVDLGMNRGISNSADKGTINVSSSNTLIAEKIDKIERQIREGKLRFMDDEGNPLVPTAESDKGYGTNSLLEQWRDSYLDNDDYDLYDDDMYENHDMFKHLQSICDDLDITVRGRKKK